ncbi:hypothetical protein LTR37_007587 [Vermiconidia calcicola]|uniref:Uncharacterized protein n=1 Tax=Vermiconidia calcicola TaxID=1690605 RepID=A0ACC3ND62_9PEZI|nr:hypothetical protein LTR37_007587 [Vermiconidia calcicola]
MLRTLRTEKATSISSLRPERGNKGEVTRSVTWECNAQNLAHREGSINLWLATASAIAFAFSSLLSIRHINKKESCKDIPDFPLGQDGKGHDASHSAKMARATTTLPTRPRWQGPRRRFPLGQDGKGHDDASHSAKMARATTLPACETHCCASATEKESCKDIPDFPLGQEGKGHDASRMRDAMLCIRNRERAVQSSYGHPSGKHEPKDLSNGDLRNAMLCIRNGEGIVQSSYGHPSGKHEPKDLSNGDRRNALLCIRNSEGVAQSSYGPPSGKYEPKDSPNGDLRNALLCIRNSEGAVRSSYGHPSFK